MPKLEPVLRYKDMPSAAAGSRAVVYSASRLDHEPVTLAADAEVFLGLLGQQLRLDDQTANTVFAAPNGAAGDPTFRALVAADLPSHTHSHDTDLTDISANDHHDQVHLLVGGSHTASGLTAGHVLRATGATSFAFGEAQHGDLGGVTSDQHHNQQHALSGSDHTGDLIFTQVDSLMGTPGSPSVDLSSSAPGTGSNLVRADHTHQLDQAISPTWTGSHTFQTTLTTRDIVPELTDTYDIGSSAKWYAQQFVSQINAAIFAEEVIQLLGGWLYIPKDAGSFAAEVGSSDTTIDFGKAMTVGDFIIVKAHDKGGAIKTEYIEVGTLVSGTVYNVTRDLASAHGTDPNWAEGVPFAVLGYSGDGRIELNAYDSPRLQMIVQGSAYNSQTEVLRVGDLNGQWGYSSQAWGMALGEYNSGKANLTLDPANGFRARSYATTRLDLTPAGVLSIRDSGGTAVFTFDASAGAEFAAPLTLGSGGGIYQGTSGSFASPGTGLKIWNDSGMGRIATFSSGTFQAGFDTSGAFTAGGGNVVLDANGLSVMLTSSFQVDRAVNLVESSTVRSTLQGYIDGSTNMTQLVVKEVAGKMSALGLQASSPTDILAQTYLQAYSGSVATQVNLLSESDNSANCLVNVKFGGVEKHRWTAGAVQLVGGLRVGAISTEPTAGDIAATGDIAAGGDVTATEDIAAGGSVSADVGASGWLPFAIYETLPYNYSGSTAAFFSATIPRAITIRSWHQAVYVLTTNDSSNYWQVQLKQEGGGVLVTLSTQGNSPGVYYVESSTGLSISKDTSHKLLYVSASKVGSPGAIFLSGPAVFVT